VESVDGANKFMAAEFFNDIRHKQMARKHRRVHQACCVEYRQKAELADGCLNV